MYILNLDCSQSLAKLSSLKSSSIMSNTTAPVSLNKVKVEARTIPNRLHAVAYSFAILALLYQHSLRLLRPHNSVLSFLLYLSMLVADLLLAFMWATNQGFRWRPVRREAFPENLSAVVDDRELPELDVFICTADPYKEPPMTAVNTALSVMAFDYPAEKVSVYVSDDGGSELTLFAFMEAAKFAKQYWLPFCRDNMIQDRCPEMYFKSNGDGHDFSRELKTLYENMKDKVDGVVERGRVSMDLLPSEDDRKFFEQYYWTAGFSRQDHPTVIRALLESKHDMDDDGQKLPNLVYVSREKRRSIPHHFKAGALNALLRVSGAMSNAPVVLTLDCDMYCNDPLAARRALCFLVDSSSTQASKVAYVQYPQIYPGLNKSDIYACEHKRLFQINPLGMDGYGGPNFVGTGCFFRRRALYGPPSPSQQWEPQEVTANGPIGSMIVLEAAQQVASCNFEEDTKWGRLVGFRYGSLVEDFFTGYRLTCEGWRSVFYNPKRAAFQGDVPITLLDALSQNQRWCLGLLEVAFSKYTPLIYGAKFIPLPLALGYAHYSHWPIYGIPVSIYGLLPPLALLNQIRLFPQLGDPWFYLYVYLFIGAYGQDLLEFLMEKGTFKRWWSDQRMWMIRGVSCYTLALVQFSLQLLGISGLGFNITNKVVDEDQNEHYEHEIFEFGVSSPLFLTVTTFSLINLIAFTVGLVVSLRRGSMNQLCMQLFIAGFVVVNGWPVYEAIAFRKDRGKMPTKVVVTSFVLACIASLLSLSLLLHIDLMA